MAAVVELESVGKRYLLGEHQGAGGSLRDALTAAAARLRSRTGPAQREHLWALRDISLSIEEGDAIGFVGRNGAGKSTLLKVITRITEPTLGVSRTRGRVGSLLEVGTGFHPELTGRENVYLNGAILGMSRREITGRFDEIAAFAGVEAFLDTPVKRYSSGMYLRLAFSVAAHLDAEILVVDEVLAVGDAAFQRKCLARMGALGSQGRTVLFVSHNLDAVLRLCRTAVWLDGGRLRAVGSSGDVVAAYLADQSAPLASRAFAPEPGQAAQLRSVRLLDAHGRETAELSRAEPFTVEVRFALAEACPGIDLTAFVTSLRGTRVLDEAWSDRTAERGAAPGEYVARLQVPPVLAGGDYHLGLWLGTAASTLRYEEEALRFLLIGPAMSRSERILQLELPWAVQRQDAPVTADR